jgi:drug/metabolite transporter (DMT)-like permease
MYNAFLYALTVAIWGSTWLVIKFQVDTVSPLQSVLYRYVIAALLLQGFLTIIRQRGTYNWQTHCRFYLLGSFLFAWNYVLFYTATYLGLTTGLIAVIFSLMITMNILNSWVFFSQKPEQKTVIGAGIGLLGIFLVFAEDLHAMWQGGLFLALIICFIATYFASLGNMVSKSLQQRNISVSESNGWGMTYGALTLMVIVAIFDMPLVLPTTASFLTSLVFLAIIGSILAFWSYLTLLGRIGADKAAYAMIVFPIWALVLSWVFEDFEWSPLKLLGVAVILAGNIVILGKKKRA